MGPATVQVSSVHGFRAPNATGLWPDNPESGEIVVLRSGGGRMIVIRRNGVALASVELTEVQACELLGAITDG